MDRRDHGRARLVEWAEARPQNWFDDDPYLRSVLARRLSADQLARLIPALRQAGADSAGPLERAAAELDRPEHLPRLEVWSAVGERSDEIRFHPSHHAAGRLVWRSGVLGVLAEPGGVTAHTALTYLFAQNGEVPHLCSVACTAGLVTAGPIRGTTRRWRPRKDTHPLGTATGRVLPGHAERLGARGRAARRARRRPGETAGRLTSAAPGATRSPPPRRRRRPE